MAGLFSLNRKQACDTTIDIISRALEKPSDNKRHVQTVNTTKIRGVA